MRNKKLLYVASNMQHINNFHLDYIKALRDEGYTVEVMAKGDGADINVPFEKKLFSPKNTLARKLIKRVISERNYDAILLNTSLAAFHVRFACRRHRRPRIVNLVHGYLFSADTNPLKRALLTLCEKITSSRTDAIITMNEADYEIATSKRLTSGQVYRVRGMGAVARDIISEPENLRREFFAEGAYVMTFIGELSGRKNQLFLIEALKIIKEHIPEAVLCLVGDGGEREALELRTDDIIDCYCSACIDNQNIPSREKFNCCNRIGNSINPQGFRSFILHTQWNFQLVSSGIINVCGKLLTNLI